MDDLANLTKEQNVKVLEILKEFNLMEDTDMKKNSENSCKVAKTFINTKEVKNFDSMFSTLMTAIDHVRFLSGDITIDENLMANAKKINAEVNALINGIKHENFDHSVEMVKAHTNDIQSMYVKVTNQINFIKEEFDMNTTNSNVPEGTTIVVEAQVVEAQTTEAQVVEAQVVETQTTEAQVVETTEAQVVEAQVVEATEAPTASEVNSASQGNPDNNNKEDSVMKEESNFTQAVNELTEKAIDAANEAIDEATEGIDEVIDADDVDDVDDSDATAEEIEGKIKKIMDVLSGFVVGIRDNMDTISKLSYTEAYHFVRKAAVDHLKKFGKLSFMVSVNKQIKKALGKLKKLMVGLINKVAKTKADKVISGIKNVFQFVGRCIKVALGFVVGSVIFAGTAVVKASYSLVKLICGTAKKVVTKKNDEKDSTDDIKADAKVNEDFVTEAEC